MELIVLHDNLQPMPNFRDLTEVNGSPAVYFLKLWLRDSPFDPLQLNFRMACTPVVARWIGHHLTSVMSPVLQISTLR